MRRYQIINDQNIATLSTRIEEYLAAGWDLVGAPFVVPVGMGIVHIAQAMTKTELHQDVAFYGDKDDKRKPWRQR